jgi:hypothetical protein
MSLPELRGDAVIYLWDQIDVDDALGYHEKNARGIPFGIVFVQLSDQLDEPWSVTFSHDALELIGDPEVNLLAAGPHPGDKRKQVFHWYEMCDAVQNERYAMDGVDVSNFLLPLFHTRNGGGRPQRLPRTALQRHRSRFVRYQPRRLHRLFQSGDRAARDVRSQR